MLKFWSNFQGISVALRTWKTSCEGLQPKPQINKPKLIVHDSEAFCYVIAERISAIPHWLSDFSDCFISPVRQNQKNHTMPPHVLHVFLSLCRIMRPDQHVFDSLFVKLPVSSFSKNFKFFTEAQEHVEILGAQVSRPDESFLRSTRTTTCRMGVARIS